MTSRLGRILS
uniref:Uncharacterized protein n=1 Tax=Rhizophora mucronata TaxID=61149 RepID=A0A2P2NBL1_RHIMU